MQNKLEDMPFVSGKLFVVDNYLEAAGLIDALRAGIAPESVRRPLSYTKVHETISNQDELIQNEIELSENK